MTRKDYELIAKSLYYNRPSVYEIDHRKAAEYHQWLQDCAGIASALQADNPRFAREKFLKACGID